MKKKAVAVVAGACALGMLLSGCGGSGGDSSASGGANVITAFNSEPQNALIPGDTNETGGGKVGQLLFANLVRYDSKGDTKMEVADSIEPNKDATQYTVKLKDGWKFTDGTPVTAESFTKSWSYTANAKNAQKCSSFFSMIKGYDDLQKDGLKGDEQLEGLKVVDDKTFTVDLAQPDSVFPIKVGYLAFAPLPESFYKDPKAFGEKPVGNGMYKLDKWDHNSQIVLTKNADYKGEEKPKNDGVTFKIYTDVDAAYADVQAGNLDVMDTVPASATKTFEKDSSIEAYNKAGSVIQTFTIPANMKHWETNTEEGQLRRQALSMAIDREQLVTKVLNGVGTAATDFTAPAIPGYSKDLKNGKYLKANPSEAKKLWDQAEAISKWDGTLTFSFNADGGAKPIYDAIVNQVKNNLGIKAATNPMPTFQEFRNAVSERKIDGAFRTGWQPDYPSAENYLYQLYDSRAADGNGSNDGDYKNAEVDELLNKAAAATKSDKQIDLYHQVEEILLEQLPAIPIYYTNADGVAAKGIKGFEMDWQNQPIYENMTK
ncbi:peptide ABC transporter substrate-binding protein [Bifidobacterium pseudolongum]|uniref:ABC transporter substrate-binding protein n=1 Tax=Bifidobacterium pseudolongum subsp. globosum TaxID=1690 RepID=A0A2N3QW86_9BIFI|nr:ABC transporter substrate-binding protein [Bifidobacterium pseudolongum]PKU96809.1 ABC transporter substrate-binding protein [Bifidobacterium pseudolongum subsp. globosum]PKV02515.1 ABC transporter substrate-binding protein [Bifidobacterium pseudolongum subsp. globosum]RYQ73687.1 ABC transporter substrate-binding protein [Bifidobacterium pseudolongum subsp. globosum]RYQ74735.1 ABC transporter substrate-binding protein [Bifidobacterium pseudolongum subsp. globosum]